MKLSKMLGTSIEYWLNSQNAYDTVLAQIASGEKLEFEKSERAHSRSRRVRIEDFLHVS